MEKITLLQVKQRFLPSSSPSSCINTKPFTYPHQNQQWLHPQITTFKFIIISTNPSSIRHNICVNCRRPWDSNAEFFRTRKFKTRFYDDDDDEEENSEKWYDVWEEFIEQAWILKVLKSYGWMLPGLISSFILTTGAKAFLLTLAIPLAQTALSLAFQKVRALTQNTPKRKGNARKKTRGTSPKHEEKGERGRSGKGNTVFQTWAADNRVADKSGEESTSFGGWEDLDMGRESQFEEGSDRTAEMKRSILRSKMSKREARSATPLLLRLLISVFPFLSSWTRML